MSFKWLENLLSKESNTDSLDNNSKRYNDPMGLAGPLPYMSGGASKIMVSEVKALKPAFMTGGDWSSYIKNLVKNEKNKVSNFNIKSFLPNLIENVKKAQGGG